MTRKPLHVVANRGLECFNNNGGYCTPKQLVDYVMPFTNRPSLNASKVVWWVKQIGYEVSPIRDGGKSVVGYRLVGQVDTVSTLAAMPSVTVAPVVHQNVIAPPPIKSTPKVKKTASEAKMPSRQTAEILPISAPSAVMTTVPEKLDETKPAKEPQIVKAPMNGPVASKVRKIDPAELSGVDFVSLLEKAKKKPLVDKTRSIDELGASPVVAAVATGDADLPAFLRD